ncbi:response regulator transcription factor [Microlunatus panaciterrae]|uniref:DNA-binding response OmpR family regulator n=1 Tax=Microlunatus panaciterrae TaxID=400768 RepID=A0ABS2RKE8_9ACTN|nr:response regulator transcription factor [Microlunatus panaciterrae]MBM7799480.1 DNA-binding response OmpR family regulator [Microlunatus panaciterrae]
MTDGTDRVAVVIEDDDDIRNLLEAVLEQAGFTTHAFSDGMEGVAAIRQHSPILTTLDINLPSIDGFEVARRIRRFSSTYIIMLTARLDEIDTLMGLDAGADDYLTKPFRHRELRARIEAMLRRTRLNEASSPAPATGNGDADRVASLPAASTVEPPAEPAEPGEWLMHNGLSINPEMRLCQLDGTPVELTRSEFDVLRAIMERQRRVIAKDDLVLLVRGDEVTGGYVADADRRALEVHIANLRRKLNDRVAAPRFIETVRGVGYRLAERRDRR